MAMLRSFLLIFIIFSMGNAEVGLVEKCPYGWTNFGLRCYKFFPRTVNWFTAEKNCQRLGANLASVSNKVENDFLLSLLPSPSTISWIGGHDGEQEGKWLWSDGAEFNFANWGSGEPNNGLGGGAENCLAISWIINRDWNDATCSAQISYICATNL